MGKAYLVGGDGYGSPLPTNVEEYNPLTNNWANKNPSPFVLRSSGVAIGSGNTGYYGTGRLNYPTFRDFYKYNPFNDSWSQLPPVPGDTGRYDASVFSIAGKIYVGNGARNSYNSPLGDFYCYDTATATWQAIRRFALVGRSSGVGFSIGGKGYFGGGGNPGLSYSSFSKYDTAINAWTQIADFPSGSRTNAVAFTIGDRGYVGTGFSDTGACNDFWEYSSTNNIWTQKAPVGNVGRYGAVGFSIDGKGYIGTGITANNSLLSDFYEYNPLINLWHTIPGLPTTSGRYAASAFSINGKGYVFYGVTNTTSISGYYSDVWAYDPVALTWTQKANIPGNGYYGAADLQMRAEDIHTADAPSMGFFQAHS